MLRQILIESFERWRRHQAAQMAAVLAFYSIFSLAPAAMLVLAVSSHLLGEEAATSEVATLLDEIVGSKLAAVIFQAAAATRSDGSASFALAAAIALSLLGATAVFVHLRQALTRVWGEDDTRPYWKQTIYDRVLGFSMIPVIGALVGLSAALNTGLSAIGRRLGSSDEISLAMLQSLTFAASLLLLALLFAAMFKFLPATRVAWREVWLGALITALLFTLGGEVIGFYLGRAALVSLYGAAGSFVALLLWVYYSAQVLLFGAELTRVLGERDARS